MLTTEWRRRIEGFRKELHGAVYRSLGTLQVEGFVTTEQLTLEEAAKRAFQPMPPGTAWGKTSEYGWFRTNVKLPAEAAGERIVLQLNLGEGVKFVDGKAVAGTAHVTLTPSGKPGQEFRIMTEIWAGNPMECGGGPVRYNRVSVPESGQTRMGVRDDNTFGVWEETVFQLLMDVETLWCLRETMFPDNALVASAGAAQVRDTMRCSEIDQALRDFTNIIDLETGRDELRATAAECRKRLKPVLDCVNGSTSPLVTAFGHAHLDVAWLWPLAQTERKAATTMANQLDLCEEYPEYKFLHSQAHLYLMVKNRYPEIYARAKAAVHRGQFIAEGGMWVEADTNIPSGESLIRQFLHGKRFFREELGVENEFLWLPDVFGFSGAMPQIMQGCGIKYFSTGKIMWNYNGGEDFPYNTFSWEGIDGTKVLAHYIGSYGSETKPQDILFRANSHRKFDEYWQRGLAFGWSDGGGGPTREHLEFLRREKNLEGLPRTRIGTPVDIFKDIEREKPVLPNYKGELYYQCHRGTYTSQAKAKKNNRKSELMLRDAELWGSVASRAAGFKFPHAEMRQKWQDVLLNQFHDIIPGSSISRVYQEANAAYDAVITTAEKVSGDALAALRKADGVTVVNSLSWERTGIVALPPGARVPPGAVSQTIDGQTLIEVQVPSMGYASLPGAVATRTAGDVHVTGTVMENDLVRVAVGPSGNITSIVDKSSGRELCAGPCNEFRMYKDIPSWFDAWDIDSMYTESPVRLESTAEVRVVASGPLVAAIEVKRKLDKSALTQRIILRRHTARIDFETVIDWQESHRLLKVNFPVAIHTEDALHEIQFGHVRRPTNRSKPIDRDRFEVSNQKWTALAEENCGCAILNDSKYGISCEGNSMNLTLLKSALAPDMTADRGIQEFTYSFYAWGGSFAESGVIREGYDLNCPLRAGSGDAGTASWFSVDAPNVIIETVKPADDGSGDIVVRLFEAQRTQAETVLRTGLKFKDVRATDMLEQGNGKVVRDAEGLVLSFRPFEIKTLRFS